MQPHDTSALISRLRSLPMLSEVEAHDGGGAVRPLCRLANPTFGRNLNFLIEPVSGGGLRLVVPNLMVAPLHSAFAPVHWHVLLANGPLTGRGVLTDQGRVHYDLLCLAEPTTAELGELIAILERDVRQLLGTLMATACATLLPVSPEMALAMVQGVDEGSAQLAPRIAV